MRRFANGLAVLARDLADQEENWTRFVLVSAIPIRLDPRISCKTSLVFSTPHRLRMAPTPNPHPPQPWRLRRPVPFLLPSLPSKPG